MSGKDRGEASSPEGRGRPTGPAWVKNPLLIIAVIALMLGFGGGYIIGHGGGGAVAREGANDARQIHGPRWALFGKPRAKGAARPAVMIGGIAINRFNPLAAVAGADAHSADAQSAVMEAARITGA